MYQRHLKQMKMGLLIGMDLFMDGANLYVKSQHIEFPIFQMAQSQMAGAEEPLSPLTVPIF